MDNGNGTMSFMRYYSTKGGSLYDSYWSTFPASQDQHHSYQQSSFYDYNNYNQNKKIFSSNCNYNRYPNVMLGGTTRHDDYQDALRIYKACNLDSTYVNSRNSPCYKRRKFSDSEWGSSSKYCYQPTAYANTSNYSNAPASTRPSASGRPCTTGKRVRSELENDSDAILMSKEEIERCSPSRKDGIDVLHETRLRYSYCAFIQNLGMQLDVPQTTIGTAMVLCHRFFIRRSHACHDRYLIATAALFLAAKSEETGRPLNNVLTASCEIIHRQDMSILTYMLPILTYGIVSALIFAGFWFLMLNAHLSKGWFEQYRERVLEAEQLILTTLNFELEVEHPFDPLTSILDKLGLSQSMLVNLALSLVGEGLRSSLWLQYKPQHIAAGAVYLASKMLNMDPSSCQNIWSEFRSPQHILHEVSEQLKELF
ncbi:hypothetical protein V2J09_014181 [Rumex salicifolius]